MRISAIVITHYAHHREVVTRFVREAQAAVKLKSKYVCKVHDVGSLENGSPYMVTVLMDGTEFGALIAMQGQLGAGKVVELMLQVITSGVP